MNGKKQIFYIILIFCLSVFWGPIKSLAWIDPQSYPVSHNAEYCLTNGDGSGINSGEKIEVEFPAGFSLADLTISDTESASEVSVWYGDPNCGGGGAGVERITEAIDIADDDRDMAVIIGNKVVITMEDGLAETDWGIKFTDKTDGNSNAVITPATANAYFIYSRKLDASDNVLETYIDLAYVGNNGEVTITGNIDPTLTFDLSDSTCNLGSFSSANVKTCSYSTTVSTNGISGYASFITADGTFRNGTHSFTGASGLVDVGTEVYGVSTTNQGGGTSIALMTDINLDTFINQDDCTDLDTGTTSAPASGIDDTGSWIYANSYTFIADDITYLCHAASIEDLTPAGTYAQLVTVTTVANF